MLHPMGPHPQSMGFQPKTETNTADYQVSVSLIMSFWNFAALKALDFMGKQSLVYWPLLNMMNVISNYLNRKLFRISYLKLKSIPCFKAKVFPSKATNLKPYSFFSLMVQSI